MVRASWVSCALASVSTIDSAVDSLESGSILQTTKLGSMNLAVKDGPAYVSEAWFIAEVEGYQTTADTLSENFDACHDQNPHKDVLKTAHDDHGLCRVEQLAMASLNSGKDCEDSKKEDCDHMQSVYEKVVCASDQSCQECHTGVSEAIAQLKKLESSNQGLYVLVFGKHTCEIRNHGTNVDCDDAQPETPLLSVTYPSEPDAPCASPSTLPGGADWSIEEYQGQNWSNLVADVSPCSKPEVMKFIGEGFCANAKMKRNFNYAVSYTLKISEQKCKDYCFAVPDCVGFNSRATLDKCTLYLEKGTQATADMMPGGTGWIVVVWPTNSDASAPITQVRTGTNLATSGKCFAKIKPAPVTIQRSLLKKIGNGYCMNSAGKMHSYLWSSGVVSAAVCKENCLATAGCVGVDIPTATQDGRCCLFFKKNTPATITSSLPGGASAWTDFAIDANADGDITAVMDVGKEFVCYAKV